VSRSCIGHSGYAWIFLSNTVTLLEFRETRASRVAQEVFGEKPLDGVLVVDRYNGYNQIPVQIQYCYAHLLRDIEKLEQEYPDHEEIGGFVSHMAVSLTQAMKLRGMGLSKLYYLTRAKDIQSDILKEIEQKQYTHLAIQRIQQLFREQNTACTTGLKIHAFRLTTIAQKEKSAPPSSPEKSVSDLNLKKEPKLDLPSCRSCSPQKNVYLLNPLKIGSTMP